VADLKTILEPGFGLDLIAAVRDERLDAAIVSLPAPTAGLRELLRVARQRPRRRRTARLTVARVDRFRAS
jgi:hypothetical protein